MSWSSDTIIPGREYGNPRAQAAQQRYEPSQQTIHGMNLREAEAFNQRMSEMMPKLVTADPSASRRGMFDSELPKGATWGPRTAQYAGVGGTFGLGPGAPAGAPAGSRSMNTMQFPYQPEFSSPDRQNYPVHRILANRYWRLFIKLDPVVGTGLDMFAEMAWSDCKLTGEGVEGEVRDLYEAMWEECMVLNMLPVMTREFLGIGEVCPHLFFDNEEGMWTYCALHNPDCLEVIDAPFIKMEPIVEFVPDDRLRSILMSTDPELQDIRNKMPPELIAKLYSRQNIRINTDVNATFIARKLHPYETRGTSLLSRMWRIFMYEDCLHPSTQITMADKSQKCIADLTVGDIVLDRHLQPQTVLAVVPKPPEPIYKIKVGETTLLATGTHRWPVVRGGKEYELHSYELRIGDSMYEFADDKMTVSSVCSAVFDGSEETVGITVSGDHSYIANGIATYNSVFNASIATARRHAGPIKFAKLGNPQTNWIPGPEQEQRLAELLAQAETDPHCFVPSTPVVLGDGTTKPIGELNPGDVVLDRSGTPCEVMAVQEEWTDKLIRIVLPGSEEIECTPNHKWPVFGVPRTCSCGCGTPIDRGNFAPTHCNPGGAKGWKRTYWKPEGAPCKVGDVKLRFLEGFDPVQKLTADQIHRGDCLMIPRTFKEKRPDDVTTEKARLLGYYAAQGNMRKVYERDDGSVRWGFELSLNEKDIDVRNDVFKIVKDLCGFEPWSEFGDRHNLQIRVHRNDSSDLSCWLRQHAGEHAKEKRLSIDVMQWPLDLKWEFIKGYAAGDGSSIACVGSDNRRYVEFGSASETLIDQVKLLLVQLGTYASKSYRRQSEKSFGAGKDFWRLHVHGALAARLSQEVWRFEANVPDRTKSGPIWWADDNFVYVKVKRVEIVDRPSKVINMTVSGDHTYLAGLFSTYNSWILWNYGLQLEAFGTTERMMTINREWDIIERIKLAAMGISRSFLTGELTFASATAGLQVFLRRLQTLRNYFETVWIKPKFFRPIAEINQFYRRDKAELAHRVRIKRTAQEIEEQRRLIVPKIDWANKLNPMVDRDLIAAYEQLERLGLRISKTKKMASVNLAFEDELRKSIEEDKYENSLRKEYGESDETAKPEEIAKIVEHTDESLPDKEQESKAQQPPGGQPPPNPRMGTRTDTRMGKLAAIWDEHGEAYGWRKEDVDGLLELLSTGETDSANWSRLEPTKGPDGAYPPNPYALLQDEDAEGAWELIDRFMQDEGYPDKAIENLRKILVYENVFPSQQADADAFLSSLPDDTAKMTDREFGEAYAAALEQHSPFVAASRKAKVLVRGDSFLVGEGSAHSARRVGIGDGFAKSCSCHTAIETPHFDAPANHDTRATWQEGLDHSQMPETAKGYIRQLENEAVDGWQDSFGMFWKEIEHRLNKGQRLDPSVMRQLVQDCVRRHMRVVDTDAIANAFTGLYSEGKDHSYKPTDFRQKKIDKLKRRSGKTAFVREAVTIDTHEDKLMLQHIKNTALQKVKTITDQGMLQGILQGLTEPGAENKNPLQIADEIVMDEAEKKRLQTDYYNAEERDKLKNQLQDLYENQLWKVQRIMRTEAINGFVLAQLQGYKEQGIVKIQWNSHHDERVCPKCRALDGVQFEIDDMLANGNRYPLTSYSHPNCRCWCTPVVAYVTFDEFAKQYDKTHPTKFVKGEPIFDESKLDISDTVQDAVPTKLTEFSNVPVEHVAPLEAVVKKIEDTPYAGDAPGKVEFVKDVFDNPEYKKKEPQKENLAGQVVLWHDLEEDKTLISSYAAEYDKIDDTYVRAWANQVWAKHPEVQAEWIEAFDKTPERTQVPAIDPVSAWTLKGAFAVGQTYYLDKGDAVGLTKKFRDLPDSEARKALRALGLPKDDASVVVQWRRSIPLWDLKTGDARVDPSEDDESRYVTYEASLSPLAFFRESCLSYMRRPWALLRKDPELYAEIRGKVFGGKEFLTG